MKIKYFSNWTHFNPKNSLRLLLSDCLTFFSSILVVRTLTGTAYSGFGRFVVCRVNLLTDSLGQSFPPAVSIEWLCSLILIRVVVFLPKVEPLEMESTEGVLVWYLLPNIGPFILFALAVFMSAMVFWRILLLHRSTIELGFLPKALFDRRFVSDHKTEIDYWFLPIATGKSFITHQSVDYYSDRPRNQTPSVVILWTRDARRSPVGSRTDCCEKSDQTVLCVAPPAATLTYYHRPSAHRPSLKDRLKINQRDFYLFPITRQREERSWRGG